MTEAACPNCGRQDHGDGRFCQWCDQFQLDSTGSIKRATIGRRFAALVLDTVLVFATLFIGYLIWWLFTLDKGQTPGKQIVGIRIIKTNGAPSRWGWTFLREFVVEVLVIGTLSGMTGGIIGLLDLLWALWDKESQTLHDKVVDTFVIRIPQEAPARVAA